MLENERRILMHILLSQTKDLVKKEKHFTYLILANLKKIEESKLYCDLGYSSLHAYLEKELGYSSAESALRVANIKLMKVSPLAEEKIKEGAINLTQGGTLFQAIGKSDVENKPAKMEEVFSLIGGKSTRESEKIINDLFGTKGKVQKKCHSEREVKRKTRES